VRIAYQKSITKNYLIFLKGDKMTKQIIKCPRCNHIMKAMSSGMWMCRNDGYFRDATPEEMKLWKIAFNKHGKQ
jgi:ribosomal protein L37AE/L43A